MQFELSKEIDDNTLCGWYLEDGTMASTAESDAFDRDEALSYTSDTEVNMAEERANKIRVANDDLFQKQKARTRTHATPEVARWEDNKKDIKGSINKEDEYQIHPLQKEVVELKTKLQNVQATDSMLKVANDDLFWKQRARHQTYEIPKEADVKLENVQATESKLALADLSLKEKATIFEAKASEIKVANDDIFQKQKAKALTFKTTKEVSELQAKLQNVQVTNSQFAMADLSQKEKSNASTFVLTKATTGGTKTSEIQIVNDDIFLKQKARSSATTKEVSQLKAKLQNVQATDSQFAMADLSQKEKTKASICSNTETTASWTRASEIKVANDDLFQKQKGRMQIPATTTEVAELKAKLQNVHTFSSRVALMDVIQKGKDESETCVTRKVITAEAMANEIKVANDDLFRNMKARK